MDFLLNLDPLLKGFWFVAIPASVIFLIQTIMTFVGTDSSDGTQADFDGDLSGVEVPFQLFSLRNLINFLLGFGWMGISFYDTISNKLLLVFLALVVGFLFVYLFFLVIRQLMKLAEDDSFNYSKTINKTAEVYLTIPSAKSGRGKVLVSVGGSVRELDAMTEGDVLPSGTSVKIVRIENEDMLVVEKF